MVFNMFLLTVVEALKYNKVVIQLLLQVTYSTFIHQNFFSRHCMANTAWWKQFFLGGSTLWFRFIKGKTQSIILKPRFHLIQSTFCCHITKCSGDHWHLWGSFFRILQSFEVPLYHHCLLLLSVAQCPVGRSSFDISLALEVPQYLIASILYHPWWGLSLWHWNLSTDVPINDFTHLFIALHECVACLDLTSCYFLLNCLRAIFPQPASWVLPGTLDTGLYWSCATMCYPSVQLFIANCRIYWYQSLILPVVHALSFHGSSSCFSFFPSCFCSTEQVFIGSFLSVVLQDLSCSITVAPILTSSLPPSLFLVCCFWVVDLGWNSSCIVESFVVFLSKI